MVSSGNYQKVLTIDGVKAYTSESGWFLIRVSNTTPYLVARVEGIDNKEVENIKDILTTLLARFDLSIK